MYAVTKQFEFSAAHHLTKYKGKCERPHGHNYQLEVTVAGDLNEDDLVIDFGDVKDLVHKYVLNELDHTDLNDRFDNPSCELIAQWIFVTLKRHIPVTQVQLWETATSSVTYNET